jgi:hypothetical protein
MAFSRRGSNAKGRHPQPASMTKPLVAVGALMLVEDGSLLLNSPVKTHQCSGNVTFGRLVRAASESADQDFQSRALPKNPGVLS